jgi:hypothetical protein
MIITTTPTPANNKNFFIGGKVKRCGPLFEQKLTFLYQSLTIYPKEPIFTGPKENSYES